jgi:hypothetical protein
MCGFPASGSRRKCHDVAHGRLLVRLAERTDRTLEKHRAAWRKSQKKLTLSEAVAYCTKRHIADPPWLKEALYETMRTLVVKETKRTGRRTNLMLDDLIYTTVEDYLRCGFTQVKAWERTAKDFSAELRPTKRRREGGAVETVKNIWLRHKTRIEPPTVKGPEEWPLGWSIKKKYLRGHDKHAPQFFREDKDIPAYLRSKQK